MNRYYTHFFYMDLLKGLKLYINNLTRETITNFEFNTATKASLQKKIYESKGVINHPRCFISMDDIQVQDTKHIQMDGSVHYGVNGIIGDNFTKNEVLLIKNKQVTVSINVTLTFDNYMVMLSYMDHFLSTVPKNYMLNPYTFVSYINVDPITEHWDYANDNIENISLTIFEQSTQLFGKFAEVKYKPLIQLNDIQKNEDREQEIYTLSLNFMVVTPVPQMIYLNSMQTEIKNIQVVLALSEQLQHMPVYLDLGEEKNQYNRFLEDNTGQKYDFVLFAKDLDFERNYIKIPIDTTDLDFINSMYRFAFYFKEDTFKVNSESILIFNNREQALHNEFTIINEVNVNAPEDHDHRIISYLYLISPEMVNNFKRIQGIMKPESTFKLTFFKN